MEFFKKQFSIYFLLLLLIFGLISLPTVNAEESEKVTFIAFGHVYEDYDALELSIPLIEKENPDFVVFLGDNIFRRKNITWDLLNPILNKINVPVYFSPGNHDILDAPLDEEYFKKNLSISDFLFQEFTIGGNTFIILNSAISKSIQDMSNEQVDFIKSIYNRNKNNKIIFIHHGLYYKDNPRLGGVGKPNSNWNSKIVPIIQNKTLAVFTGDGIPPPYFHYIEENISYFGVGFSSEKIMTPPHILKVIIEDKSLVVTPIPIRQDLVKIPYNILMEEKIASETFISRLKTFLQFNLKLIFIIISLIIILLLLIVLALFNKNKRLVKISS